MASHLRSISRPAAAARSPASEPPTSASHALPRIPRDGSQCASIMKDIVAATSTSPRVHQHYAVQDAHLYGHFLVL